MTAYDIPSIRRMPKLEIEPLRLTKMLSGTRKIFIAIPSPGRTVKIDTMVAVMDGQIDALIREWAFEVHTSVAVPISTARNLLLAEFLASDCEDIVFIDHDINWKPGDLVKLIDYPVEFVGAVPPYRGEPSGFPVRWDANQKYLVSDPTTGLLKVAGIPFGFVRLKRSAVERMVKEYHYLEYDHPHAPNGVAWRLFSFELYDRSDWSEDMVFCRRWIEIGGTVWIDPMVKFSHTGEKAFFGCLGEFMRDRASFAEEAKAYQDSTAREAVGQTA